MLRDDHPSGDERLARELVPHTQGPSGTEGVVDMGAQQELTRLITREALHPGTTSIKPGSVLAELVESVRARLLLVPEGK